MTLVFRLSPGVTTRTLSAHRPAATLMDVLLLPDIRVRYRFDVSKEKKRTPDFIAFEVARVWQPEYTLLRLWFAIVERRMVREEEGLNPLRETSS